MRLIFFIVCVGLLFVHEATCVDYQYVGCFHGNDITGGYIQREVNNPDANNAEYCAYFCHTFNHPYFFLKQEGPNYSNCGCHNSTIAVAPVSDNNCNAGCAPNNCGGGSTLQVNDQSTGSAYVAVYSISSTIAKPAPPALPASVGNHVGCFGSGVSIASSPPSFKYNSSSDVVAMCQQQCLTSHYFALFGDLAPHFALCYCVSSVTMANKVDQLQCNKECAGVPCGGSFYEGGSPATNNGFGLSTTFQQNAGDSFVSVYSNTFFATPKSNLVTTKIFTDSVQPGFSAAMSSPPINITTVHAQSQQKSIAFDHIEGNTIVFYRSQFFDARYSNTQLSFWLFSGWQNVTLQLFTLSGSTIVPTKQAPQVNDLVTYVYPWRHATVYLNNWFPYGVYDGFMFTAAGTNNFLQCYVDTIWYIG